MPTLEERLLQSLEGRYTIERPLGAGGMAVVYLAHDPRHDRHVAVKVLRPEVSAEIGAERFLREIKMAAGLTHPHILPVYDSGQAGDLLFYVMPSMEGNSLREKLDKEKQLPLDVALRIAREVASALDYAHRHKVVHRDIKPENILLHDGSAMVADFGIGKALTSGGSITKTGIAIGTPSYMSPEQASGESEVDGRSDLYSLGCVLYEMLTGEPPFTGPTVQSIIAKRFMSPIPKIRATRDVPEPVDALVSRTLARTPVDRPASAGALAEAIEQLLRGGNRTTPTGSTTEGRAAQKSVAVMPLTNMSADPENEYFSDGMTEEVINALAKVPGLQVASRSSCFAFKGKPIDVREVGDKLGVATVLEGSVRKVGNRIRIAAQLVSVENGYQLWSETFDRQLEDVFAIQDEISRAIAEALKLRLVRDQNALAAHPTNLEAYNNYLKGRFHFSRDTEAGLRKSLEFYQHVLLQDPGYGRAYAGIADCWCSLADDWVAPDDAYPRAKSAAQRALEFDPDLAEAMTSLGKVLAWYEWKFSEGEHHLRRAVALNPNYAEAHWSFGSVLPAVGLLDEAIGEMRKALVLDPLYPQYSRWLSRFLLYSGQLDAAMDQGQQTLELAEDSFQSYLDIGCAWFERGDSERAMEWFRRGQSLKTAVRAYDAHIVRALATLDRLEEANEIMTRLEEESKRTYMRSEVLAMGYASLKDFDRAFKCLEKAYQARSAGLIYLHVDQAYKPLRADPRYTTLIGRIGLR
jgi:serine/threonine-protein kinase